MRGDQEVASGVREALHHDISVPDNAVQAEVKDGRETLTGSVDWHFERRAAEDDARKIYGVQSVRNEIRINQPAASSPEIHKSIEQALVRNARIDSDRVKVSVNGGHVTLNGEVKSWAEREEAEDAAWRARGVNRVTDNVRIV